MTCNSGLHRRGDSQGLVHPAEVVVHEVKPKRIRALTDDGLWAFVDGSDNGLPVKELTVVSVETIEKPVEQSKSSLVAPKPPKPESSAFSSIVPKMRSYSWALSGDFSAKMDLFGDARTEEDIDALADYVEITIKALKRSLKSHNERGIANSAL